MGKYLLEQGIQDEIAAVTLELQYVFTSE